MEKESNVFNAALAGLLHDVGTFTCSTFAKQNGLLSPEEKQAINYHHSESIQVFIEQYVPKKLREQGLDVIRYHQKTISIPKELIDHTSLAHIVRLANQWASGERSTCERVEQATYREAPLIPVLSQLKLESEGSKGWYYSINKLQLEREVIFPVDKQETEVEKARFELWEGEMRPELDCWKNELGETWDSLTPESYFSTLLMLFRKYLTFLPSASFYQNDGDEREWSDVSLFDHLKITAAIGACLAAGFKRDELMQLDIDCNIPVALIIRGNLSGIQSWIYRITRPEADASFDHVAKRLRGRSFYLAIVTEVIARWIVRSLGVTEANILFLGGGRFDLLVPIKSEGKLKDISKKIEDWLLKVHYGELGIQMATEEIHPMDFDNMQPVYERLDYSLEQKKNQKWMKYIQDENFFITEEVFYHACPVCHTTPMQESGRACELCNTHLSIGSKLPDTKVIITTFGKNNIKWPKEAEIIEFSDFKITIGLMDEMESSIWLKSIENIRSKAIFSHVNNTDFLHFAPPGVGLGFKFLARRAPIAKSYLEGISEPVEEGNILHFAAIANLSKGASQIGILKADVDHLGILFGDGLNDTKPNGIHPTIARISAMSNVFDLFFTGWIDNICDEVFKRWEERQEQLVEDERHPWYRKVKGLFYVLYSGGDDLFVIGPWNAIIELAQRLREDFKAYACFNPDITISAGVVQVKPHFPVQRFAMIVDQALQTAKNAGRNCIQLFNHIIRWEGVNIPYPDLLIFADELCNLIEEGKIPRTLIHDLGRMHRISRPSLNNKNLKTMWKPRLYYTLARRVEKEVLEMIKPRLLSTIADGSISALVSYVSLATRKE